MILTSRSVTCGARTYDPAIGRFLSHDPIGLLVTNDTNLYVYTANQPVTSIDASGMDAAYFPNPYKSESRGGSCPSASMYKNWTLSNDPIGDRRRVRLGILRDQQTRMLPEWRCHKYD